MAYSARSFFRILEFLALVLIIIIGVHFYMVTKTEVSIFDFIGSNILLTLFLLYPILLIFAVLMRIVKKLSFTIFESVIYLIHFIGVVTIIYFFF